MNLNIMNEFGDNVIEDWPAIQQAQVKGFISRNEINVDHGWIYAGHLAGTPVYVLFFPQCQAPEESEFSEFVPRL